MVYKDPRTGATLGGALREWREGSNLTLYATADACGVTITHLMDVESDKIGPSASLLTKLGRCYGDEFIGSQRQAGWIAVMGWLQMIASLDSPTNRQILCVVATSIREMRNLPEDAIVVMRDQEADIVFSMLNLDDEKLYVDLREAFELSEEGARAFVERANMRRDRREEASQTLIERFGPDFSAYDGADISTDNEATAA